ncbi:DUF1992 domain-containing protein [Streptomyces sp. NA04227]|uniref:DnaJ family domain-containing protein n=1 Tax=Streptomyces sp. NA04227 TaxID=2742136 RepID=UPI00159061B6|nr:DUF1992 domain-containing protein [Streptomyces sp. NA04227]QKW06259.1 DUF1992 domain-containing protein [Streptomyces sp. NA04227]
MTERKPAGVSFESWIDKQIREAQERGDFAQLPGAGKPLAEGPDTTYDEMWWIKQKMAREGLSHLPPTLALRKEAEEALEAAYAAPSERVARKIIEDINAKILRNLMMPPPGPPLGINRFDLDRVLAERARRRAS